MTSSEPLFSAEVPPDAGAARLRRELFEREQRRRNGEPVQPQRRPRARASRSA